MKPQRLLGVVGVAVGVAAALLAGCGGAGDDELGCDLRQGSAMRPECVDYLDVAAAERSGFGDSCRQVSGGHWLGGACDHSGALGGCRIPGDAHEPYVQTQWWWKGALGGTVTTTMGAEQACASFPGGAFLAP